MKYGAVQEIHAQSGKPENESRLFDRVNDIYDNVLLFKVAVLGCAVRSWYVVSDIIKRNSDGRKGNLIFFFFKKKKEM